MRALRSFLAAPGAAAVAPFAALLLLFALVALLAPWIAPLDPARQSLLARLRPPGSVMGGATFWLEIGRAHV